MGAPQWLKKIPIDRLFLFYVSDHETAVLTSITQPLLWRSARLTPFPHFVTFLGIVFGGGQNLFPLPASVISCRCNQYSAHSRQR